MTQLEQHISTADARLLDERRAVADFGGIFFDDAGRYVDTPLNDCRVAVDVEELRHTADVVAIAGQLEKVSAIRSVCASGLPTCLVTTTEVARALLALPAVESPAFVRAKSSEPALALQVAAQEA